MKAHQISQLIEKYKNKTEKYYVGSVFEDLTFLSNDEIGDWGEETLYLLLKDSNILVEWDPQKNINQDDGVYDMLVNNLRTEVKTATRGHNKNSADNWQHENIYKSPVWDRICFVDIDYSCIYFTVINHKDFCFETRHPVLGKKATLRQEQGDKWKFDCSRNTINLGLKANLTFQYNVNDPNKPALKAFLEQHFN
jgi:hypothetical protein